MSSQQLPTMDEQGTGKQPDETDDEFDPEEPDDFDEVDDERNIQPAPEPPLSDAKHDRVILVIAAIFAVGGIVLFLGITQLSSTGIFGQDCGSMPTNRSGRCYQANYPDIGSNPYMPPANWYQPFSITTP